MATRKNRKTSAPATPDWRAIPDQPHNPDLQDLQANILKGHGRGHTAYVFFRISSVNDARCWIRELKLTSMAAQLEQTRAFKADPKASSVAVQVLALAYSGLQVLGHAWNDADAAFRAGMPARSEQLRDPEVLSWDFAHPHGVLLIAHQDEAGVNAALRHAFEMNESSGVEIIRIERGQALYNHAHEGIEHFGYVDGRSQPIFLQSDLEAEIESGGIDRWNPAAPLDRVIFPDPLSSQPNAYGSYFVFRKLEQNVEAFKAREAELAQQLGMHDDDAERAGALVVGRFEDGTPLAVYTKESGSAPVLNNFNFAGSNDRRCPFPAHVRVTNPRESDAADAKSAFLMARRGITYGARAQNPETKALTDQPSGGVGLLFQAYMASILDQFERTQVMANRGLDPVIGQCPHAPQRWPSALAGHTTFGFSGFVTMRGGEYFYAPSLSGLRALT